MKDFKIMGPICPGIIKAGDKRYAVSGGNWVLIDDIMTIADVTKGWIDTKTKVDKTMLYRKVNSSRGGKVSYNVSLKDGIWKCTCSGYSFRRICSHIKKIQSEIK